MSRLSNGYLKEWLLLDVLGMLTGVAGGLGAIAFRYMIALNNHLFFEILHKGLPVGSSWFDIRLAILPGLGGLLVGFLTSRLAPETKGHGVPEVMEAVVLKMGRIRKRISFVKVLVSSITIGSGGSAGREGPIAQIGAAVGSLIGQVLKLPSHDVRLLVVCGLSAGIAGTFNAPLGGAIFGMEILLRRIGLSDAIPVILSSVVGVAVAASVLGQSLSFKTPPVRMWTPCELPLYILLGVAFGLISVLWIKTFYYVEDVFTKLHVHPYVKPALGAFIAGSLATVYPDLGIMGVGYEGVDTVLTGVLPLSLLLMLGVLKMLATSFTIGSGGSGGIFAPTLYIGSMLGAAMGVMFKSALPTVASPSFTYSLAGMAALFAGAAQAPLNVIVMIPEMSNDYMLIPPLMASSASSFLVARLFLKGSSIYTLKLERRGVRLRMGRPFSLEVVKVGEVMTRDVVTVAPGMPLPVLEILFEESHHIGYPVLEGGRLIGMVTISDLQRVPVDRRAEMKVGDVLSKKLVVTYPDEAI